MTSWTRVGAADCLDEGDLPAGCSCTGGPNDCDADGLPDATDPCPGIAQGQPGASSPVVGGFEDLRCWRALESRIADVGGYFNHFYDPALQPVAVRRVSGPVPTDAAAPGPQPWPVRTGIVIVGVAVGAKYPGHPDTGAATPAETRAAFRAGAALPNATLAALDSFEAEPISVGNGWHRTTTVHGYGIATAYARSIHDAAKVASSAVFLDAIGFLLSRDRLDVGKETVIMGSHGSMRVPGGWAPLKEEFGQTVADWPAATPLVAVTKITDSVCAAKAMGDRLKDLAKTTPIPDYSKLPVFRVEDPRWNQGAELSSRPAIVSYEAAKVSTTSPDAVVRATAFGYRPVVSSLRGPLPNGYTAAPLPPYTKVIYGPTNQYLAHAQTWEYETPNDAILAIADPDKLCEPDGEKSCSCTPKRSYFVLGKAAVKGTTADPYAWTADEYLNAPIPDALYPALHKYAVPGTPSYRTVTNAIRTGNQDKWPYTRLNVPIPADGSFRYPLRQGFLPKSLFSSGPEAAAGVYFQTPVAPSLAWVLATGTHAEVLSRLRKDDLWIADTWTTQGATGRTTIAVSFAGFGSSFSGWDKTTQSWIAAPMPQIGSSADHVEFDFPTSLVGPGLAFPGGNWPAGVIEAEHFPPSPWYPGATEWRTNYGNAQAFTQQQRTPPKAASHAPANPANALLTHFAPNLTPSDVDTAEQRNTRCGPDNYKPNNAAAHWPVVQEKGSFAGLWGQSPVTNPPPERELPNAWFADDWVGGAAVSGPSLVNEGSLLHLHEQIDINWTFREAFIDPAYRGFLKGTPTEFCYGESIVVPDLFVALSCSEPMLGDCTDSQLRTGLCNPPERAVNRVKAACSYKNFAECGGDPFCRVGALIIDSAICAGGTAIAAARLVASALPVNILSIAGGGGFVNLDELILRKEASNPARKRAMEVEIEHRIATSGKRDGGGLCGGLQCATEDFDASNGVFSGGKVVLGEVDVEGGVFGVKSFAGDHDGLEAAPATVALFPFSRFPGFASQRGAVYGATAQRMGLAGASPDLATIQANAVAILPPGVREATINASGFAKPGRQTDFRVELVGDLILDCGHPPVHAEIHPFRAGVMHATPPPADFAGFPRVTRYSLFSWVRLVDGYDPLGFEVWPPPRPREKTKIAHRFVMPTGSEWSGILCSPFPEAHPNRLRCQLAVSESFGDEAGNEDVCVHNKRMLPSCATALGGGLLEVYWE